MSDGLKSFVSGGVGGMCLVAVGHPLDTIKVRLMTDSTGEYSGWWDCLKKTRAQHGIVRGLFSGMGPPLVAVSPAFAVYFWGFDLGQRLVRGVNGNGPIGLGGIVFAGAFSAIPGTLVLLPFDLVKVKLQVELTRGQRPASPIARGLEQGPRFRTAFACLQHIIREDGVRGMFKGAGAMLLREIPSTAAYYTTYELIKKALAEKRSDIGSPNALVIITAGGFAGMANWLVAVPFDVIKTRFQVGSYPGGLRQVARELVRNEGGWAFFKGLSPALLRAFPSNAACFLGMETTRKLLDRYI